MKQLHCLKESYTYKNSNFSSTIQKVNSLTRSDQHIKTTISDSSQQYLDYQSTYQHRHRVQDFTRSQIRSSRGAHHSKILKSFVISSTPKVPTTPKATTPKLLNKFCFPTPEEIPDLDKLLSKEHAASKRQQVAQVEQLFSQQITPTNRNELIAKVQQFIYDMLQEDFKELGLLFKTLLREKAHQLTTQELDLQISRKQFEIQGIDEFNRQDWHFKRELAIRETKGALQSNEIQQLKQQVKQLQQDLTDLINKDKRMCHKHEINKKINSYQTKRIRSLEHEVESLNQKLEYVDGKLKQLGLNKLQLESKLHQMQASVPNSPRSPVMKETAQDNCMNASMSANSEELAQELDVNNLNEVDMNFDRIIEQRNRETEVDDELYWQYHVDTAVQTSIQMVDSKYDILQQESIDQAVKYNRFINNVGEKVEDSDELESDNDSIIEEAFHIPQDRNRRASLQHKELLVSFTMSKRKQKMKQIMKYLHYSKNRLAQLEAELQDTTNKLNAMYLKRDQLITTNIEQAEQNDNLTLQIKILEDTIAQLLNSKVQQESQSELLSIPGGGHHRKSSRILPQQVISIKEKKQRKAPQLGQKITISYDFQKNQSKQLIEKIKAKKIGKFQNYMALKMVVKYISTLYQDKINSQKENKFFRDQDMSSFIYNYYLQQFGYTKMTEQRFLILVLSVKKQTHIVRVNMFAKFMNLFEGHTNYTIEEQQKYLEALDYVQNLHNLGVAIKDNEGELKYYIPYVRCMAYLGQLQSMNLTQEESQALKHEIELLRENDPKNINKSGIIDFDLVMMHVLLTFRRSVDKTKTYVINAFAACDLDGNGFCNYDEWILLNKHIESEQFDEDKLYDIFEENADVVLEEEKNLSFDRFSILCMEHDLFTDKAQNKFLHVRHNQDVEEQYHLLRDNWTEQYLSSLRKLLHLDGEEPKKWKVILEVLNQRLTSEQVVYKPLLIAYRIAQEEIKQL